MEKDFIWDDEAALAYDTHGVGMFAPDVIGPAVERFAELSAGEPVLPRWGCEAGRRIMFSLVRRDASRSAMPFDDASY
jgi:hypothetical protein